MSRWPILGPSVRMPHGWTWLMSEVDWMFRELRMDTAEIGRHLDVSEAMVCRVLRQAREARRGSTKAHHEDPNGGSSNAPHQSSTAQVNAGGSGQPRSKGADGDKQEGCG
jgi:hypothetical protein